jgi:hypothetical protein
MTHQWTCQYCLGLNEPAVRQAMERREPLRLERVEMTKPWYKLSETQWAAEFFCDCCGAKTDIVIELKDEPDPADWWKS